MKRDSNVTLARRVKKYGEVIRSMRSSVSAADNCGLQRKHNKLDNLSWPVPVAYSVQNARYRQTDIESQADTQTQTEQLFTLTDIRRVTVASS